jgi:hypothetical protein
LVQESEASFKDIRGGRKRARASMPRVQASEEG